MCHWLLGTSCAHCAGFCAHAGGRETVGPLRPGAQAAQGRPRQLRLADPANGASPQPSPTRSAGSRSEASTPQRPVAYTCHRVLTACVVYACGASSMHPRNFRLCHASLQALCFPCVWAFRCPGHGHGGEGEAGGGGGAARAGAVHAPARPLHAEHRRVLQCVLLTDLWKQADSFHSKVACGGCFCRQLTDYKARLLFPTCCAADRVVLSLLALSCVPMASDPTACCRARMQGMCSAQCSTASCGSGGRQAKAKPGTRSSRAARYSFCVVYHCTYGTCTISLWSESAVACRDVSNLI